MTAAGADMRRLIVADDRNVARKQSVHLTTLTSRGNESVTLALRLHVTCGELETIPGL